MKNRYKVERDDILATHRAGWFVVDKIKDWRICEAYSKREAYDIARALNKAGMR